MRGRGAKLGAATLLAAGLASLGPTSGCQQPDQFNCTTNAECTHAGQPGVCTPAGACAFADATCPSQRRYVHFAPKALADTCYDPDQCHTDDVTCDGTSVFCEDFENGTIDTTLWTITQNQATVTVDDTRACRGTRSLHIHVNQPNAAPASGGIAQGRDLPNPVYIRAFYYFASPLPVSVADFEFLTLVGSTPPFDGSALTLQNGRVAINNYYEGQVGNIIPWQLSTTVPADRWVCIEWQISSRVDHTGSVHVWFNGEPIPSLSLSSGDGLSFAPRFGTVGLTYGYPASLRAQGFDAWVDGLIVDAQPIGCQR